MQATQLRAPRPMQAKELIDVWSFCVWAYYKQCVVAETGRMLEPAEAAADGRPLQGRSRDGVLAGLTIARVGCAIDPGRRALSSRCHPDAERLHDVVLTLPPAQARILMDFGRSGFAPRPCEVVPTYRPRPRSSHGGGAFAEGGSWIYCDTPQAPINSPSVLFRGRRCVRIERWHYEPCDDGALVWCPFTWVEQTPITTEYRNLLNDVHQAFLDALAALAVALEDVSFLDHIVIFEKNDD